MDSRDDPAIDALQAWFAANGWVSLGLERGRYRWVWLLTGERVTVPPLPGTRELDRARKAALQIGTSRRLAATA